MVTATGNALTVTGDLCRRTLPCLIDPKTECPSERDFSFCPVQRARENRGRYVVACLTILHAYNVAGRPAQKGKTFGRSKKLVSRGSRDETFLRVGCADPVELCTPQADDPAREQFGALVMAWKGTIGVNVPMTLKKVVETARTTLNDRTLLEALLAVTDDPDTAWVNAKKLRGAIFASGNCRSSTATASRPGN